MAAQPVHALAETSEPDGTAVICHKNKTRLGHCPGEQCHVKHELVPFYPVLERFSAVCFGKGCGGKQCRENTRRPEKIWIKSQEQLHEVDVSSTIVNVSMGFLLRSRMSSSRLVGVRM